MLKLLSSSPSSFMCRVDLKKTKNKCYELKQPLKNSKCIRKTYHIQGGRQEGHNRKNNLNNNDSYVVALHFSSSNTPVVSSSSIQLRSSFYESGEENVIIGIINIIGRVLCEKQKKKY